MCPYKVKGCFLLFGILFLIVDIALHTQDQGQCYYNKRGTEVITFANR